MLLNLNVKSFESARVGLKYAECDFDNFLGQIETYADDHLVECSLDLKQYLFFLMLCVR